MDIELLVKVATAAVATVGAVLGYLHYFATKRSAGYQNSKIEMELLTQSIAAYEDNADLKAFLSDVRKERIFSLIFGISIPTADVERAIAYYRDAAGKVTTNEIAKAWRYRDPKIDHLSFQLSGAFRLEYIFALGFVLFSLFGVLVGVVSWLFLEVQARQAFLLIGVSLVAFAEMAWINQELFMAARLGSLEKQKSAKAPA